MLFIQYILCGYVLNFRSLIQVKFKRLIPFHKYTWSFFHINEATKIKKIVFPYNRWPWILEFENFLCWLNDLKSKWVRNAFLVKCKLTLIIELQPNLNGIANHDFWWQLYYFFNFSFFFQVRNLFWEVWLSGTCKSCNKNPRTGRLSRCQEILL